MNYEISAERQTEIYSILTAQIEEVFDGIIKEYNLVWISDENGYFITLRNESKKYDLRFFRPLFVNTLPEFDYIDNSDYSHLNLISPNDMLLRKQSLDKYLVWKNNTDNQVNKPKYKDFFNIGDVNIDALKNGYFYYSQLLLEYGKPILNGDRSFILESCEYRPDYKKYLQRINYI